MNIKKALRLYLITDDSGRSLTELIDRVARGIEGGVTAVQFREKGCAPTMCSKAIEGLSALCSDAGVPLFLNADLMGRFEVSGLINGYHYSERTLPLSLRPPGRVHGYSAHDPGDAVTAYRHGASFCTLSPIYSTPSKQGIMNPLGLEALGKARKLLPEKPILALGGINPDNAGLCLEAGASGIAVIRAIMAAEDPKEAAQKLHNIIKNSPNW